MSLPAPVSAAAARSRDAWTPLRRHVLGPLLDGWYGHRTRAHVPGVARRLALRPAAMRRRRLRALRGLLSHARDTVPLYRERVDAAGITPATLGRAADLAGLPPLTRSDVCTRTADLLSSAYEGRVLVGGNSGGTTSEPVPFVQVPGAIWRKNAATVVLRQRIGWQAGDRTALLWGAVEDLPSPPRGLVQRLKAGVLSAAEGRLWLPAPDLSDEMLDAFAEAIRRFRPVVLQAYPSAADLLARRVLAAHAPLEVPVVLLTAETVFPAQRRRIARALQGRVYSFYGAREVGWIASECPGEQRLHLNTDGIHLEADDEGRLLVTDLVNYAMPLIRYEVGDRGRLADEACPCGDPRPVLAELHGRVNDVFLLPSGARVPGTIADVRNYQLEDGIAETQLIQDALDRLRVRWVPAPNFREEHLDMLRQHLDGCFGGELTYEFRRVGRIEPEPNGKTRYCICNVQGPP